MRVETRWRPGSALVDIWVIQDTFAEPRFLRLGSEDRFEKWVTVERGEVDVTPTLTLPDEVFKALIAEGSDILPPSAATERHLQDAIEVRDKVLGLLLPSPPEQA